MRVAADLVPACRQFAYLLGLQETRPAEHDGRDQKMAAIAPALQRVGDLQRARAAVVERQRHIGVISKQSGARAAGRERIEMALEVVWRELVARACRSREAAALALPRKDHVVVTQNPRHGATLARTRPASIDAACAIVRG